MKRDLLSVVVPCYDEAPVLDYFYEEVGRVSRQMVQVDFEFLFVDDGSRDETLQKIRALAREDSRVGYLSFSRNFGKEAAMLAGFRHARGDYVCTIDADLQEPPSLLPEMYRAVKTEDVDCAATKRISRDREPAVRSFFARMFYRIMNRVCDDSIEIVDGARDFRLMSRRMVDALLTLSEKNRFSKGLFQWVGFRTKWIPFEYAERKAGGTGWSFRKLLVYAIDGITDFSIFPLRAGAVVGAGAFLLCAILGVVLLFFDPLSEVTRWARAVLLWCVGLQGAFLGVLGIYIGKVLREVKGRPDYILAERCLPGEGADGF